MRVGGRKKWAVILLLYSVFLLELQSLLDLFVCFSLVFFFLFLLCSFGSCCLIVLVLLLLNM